MAVEITGFAIHAFAITPLARCLHATSVYIWLLDLLIYLLKRDLGSAAFSTLTRPPSSELPPDSELEKPMSLKQLRLLVSSPFRVDTPRIDISAKPSAFSRSSVLDNSLSDHGQKALPVGPVIRRSSRLPSWLGMSQSHKRQDSGESSDAILEVDVEQQAGPELVQYYNSSNTRNTRNTSKSSSPGANAANKGTFGNNSRRTSRYKHSRGTPSIASTTGTYNEDGIRLDSPIEPSMANSSPETSIGPPNSTYKATRQPTIAARRLTAMPEEEEHSPATWTATLSRPDSGNGALSSSYSTPTGAPSLLSRQSNLSLSFFPRPPSTSARTQAGDRDSRQMRRKTSINRPHGRVDYGDLEPPKMPAAFAHQHADSWQSQDTFTGSGSESPAPVVMRGFNVTS